MKNLFDLIIWFSKWEAEQKQFKNYLTSDMQKHWKMYENCQDLRDNYTKQNAVFEKLSVVKPKP